MRHDSPISRLSAYLQALGRFRGERMIEVPKLMYYLQDITQRQLREDCKAWGVPWAKELQFSAFARAVRREIHRRKHMAENIELESADIPDEKGLFRALKGRADEKSAKLAPLLEEALSYAEAQPRHFLTSHGDVEPGNTAYRHQIEEALRIAEEMLGTGIVVHEVGLGKTVTGILVLIELLRRFPDLTCLILVPTNLKDEVWGKELEKWTDLSVVVEAEYDPKSLESEPYLLLAIDSAKEKRRAEILRLRQWGLIIVDEGHWLRNNDTARYRFVFGLRARFRLLLTATPVHNSGYDIFHQVNMVRPGHLGRKSVFAESFMRDERQITGPPELQTKLTPILSQRQRHETDIRFPSRTIDPVEISNRSDHERELYDNVLSLLRGIYRWHLGSAAFVQRPSGKQQGVSQLVLIAMLVLRELASHPLSALKTMAGPLRNRVEKLASATGATDDLHRLDTKLKSIVERYGDTLRGAGKHEKTDQLIANLPTLAKIFGRVIVYVEFRETQKAIIHRLTHIEKQQLDQAGLSSRPEIISYHGELPSARKKYQIERFKHHEQAWFISTDAGGEGLNLQAGRVVVNFDFPWNPMRVEQRIGRVDRIGQQSDEPVLVQNYVTHGTIEEYVYRILREKLNVCEDVLGRVIPRIFQLESIHKRYTTRNDVLGISQVILRSDSDDDMRRRFREFSEDLESTAASGSQRWKPRRRRLDE